MLVYDPLRTAQGTLAFRAFRLKDSYLQFFHAGKFTHQEYQIIADVIVYAVYSSGMFG